MTSLLQDTDQDTSTILKRGARALTPSCMALIKKTKTVERDSAVDIAKGLGILLVIFGHTVAAWGGNQEALHRFIYAFHMPLFFGVAGLYLSPSTSLLSLTRTKLKRFLIPFVFWVSCYFLLSLMIRILTGAPLRSTDLVPMLGKLSLVPLLANWSSLAQAGISADLWFLPAVFSILMLSRLFTHVLGSQQPLFALLIAIALGWSTVQLNNVYQLHAHIPWSLDVALVCLPFLFLCPYRNTVTNWHWLAIPTLVVLIAALSRRAPVEVAGLHIIDYPRFLLTASAGLILVSMISAKLRNSWVGLQIAEVGQRAFLMFVLQGAALLLFRPLLSRVPILSAHETVFNAVLFVLCVVLTYSVYPWFKRSTFLRIFALGEPAHDPQTIDIHRSVWNGRPTGTYSWPIESRRRIRWSNITGMASKRHPALFG